MLRELKDDDIDFLFELVNDADVRKNSIKQDKISYKNHKQWFFNKLREIKSFKSKIYIYEEEGIKAGQIRLDKKGMFHIVDISIIKTMRKNGLAKKMLLELLNLNKKLTLLAYVKNSNTPSKSLFLSVGFKKVKECRDISFYKVKT